MLQAGGAAAASTEGAAGAYGPHPRPMPISCRSSGFRAPEEQAATIALPRVRRASYINGVSLDVNGGLFMA